MCTLYERDHHLGVAALINSIVASGFQGLFWVGHRGTLPSWTAQLERDEEGLFRVGEARLGFETIDSSRHFGQFKPEFLARTIDTGVARRYLWYFDPDITVRCAWSFYERWIQHGICLCQESSIGNMPSNHPIRCEWICLAAKHGWGEPVRREERYYNSGFVGLEAGQREFLERWKEGIALANAHGVHERQFQVGSRSQTFFTIDQDTMNLATMFVRESFSTMGPDGMGWETGGFAMYHNRGKMKPWNKRYLRAAAIGYPPSNGEKHFLQCAAAPISVFSPGRLSRLRIEARMASLIGRFYSRR